MTPPITALLDCCLFVDHMREFFALQSEPSHNRGAIHQVATSTFEQEFFALLPGRVENLRSLCVALP